MARLAEWMLARALPRGAHLMESGADGIRTHDLLRARQALSQLSYRPRYSKGENLFYLEGKLNRGPVS
jgi:hypothetical protein